MAKQRVRRQVDAGVKREAVRRMEERRAVQVPLATVARDLDVRPGQLRMWADQLALAALQRAVAICRPTGGAIHHADRDSTYASHANRAALAAAGLTASMSRSDDCSDNEVAERFLATLEWELFADVATRSAAMRAVVTFIETWCNPERLYSTFRYATPHAFTQDLPRRRRAA